MKKGPETRRVLRGASIETSLRQCPHLGPWECRQRPSLRHDDIRKSRSPFVVILCGVPLFTLSRIGTQSLILSKEGWPIARPGEPGNIAVQLSNLQDDAVANFEFRRVAVLVLRGSFLRSGYELFFTPVPPR